MCLPVTPFKKICVFELPPDLMQIYKIFLGNIYFYHVLSQTAELKEPPQEKFLKSAAEKVSRFK